MKTLFVSIAILSLLIGMLGYVLWRPKHRRSTSGVEQPIPEFQSIPTEAKVARRLTSSNIKWEI